MVLGLWAALAVTFVAVAVTFKWIRVPEPKWLVRVFIAVAVVATAVVAMMVVG
jgi:hypothetical protein